MMNRLQKMEARANLNYYTREQARNTEIAKQIVEDIRGMLDSDTYYVYGSIPTYLRTGEKWGITIGAHGRDVTIDEIDKATDALFDPSIFRLNVFGDHAQVEITVAGTLR